MDSAGPSHVWPHTPDSHASRSATFAELQSNEPDGPGPGPERVGAEDAIIAAQWRIFSHVATIVAVLTAPMFFLLLTRVLGWGTAAAAAMAAIAVFAFRGLVDLASRKVLPPTSLFTNASDARRSADISARRATWFWRSIFKTLIILGVLYALVVALILLGQAMGSADANLGDAARRPFEGVSNQFSSTDATMNLIGVAIGIPFVFLINTLIFLGPLLIAGIKQIRVYEPGDADWGVRWEDIRGQQRPKEEVRKVVALWQAGREFESAGGKRERGVLFAGAPGTGKTMLAKSIASGFNCPFVTAPGPAFTQAFIGVDIILVMYVGMRARRLARKWGGQCIVFIDEIDALGGRRDAFDGANARPSVHDVAFHGPMGALTPSGDLILETAAWRERLFRERAPARGSLYPAALQRISDRVRQFVFPGTGGIGLGGLQQLLVEMDSVSAPPFWSRTLRRRINTLLDATYIIPARVGSVRLRLPPARPRKEDVYFIGATNVALQALDPALLRPGRMGRHIMFRAPGREGRKDIIDLYLGKVVHDPELDTDARRTEFARITMGHSPAMIEQTCNLALTYAHHDGRRSCNWTDLIQAITVVEQGIDLGLTYTEGDARALAIHEAGHAVTGHMFMKERMSTRLTITARADSLGHHAMSEIDERYTRFQHEAVGDLVWSLGAMAAEYVFFGEGSTGVGGDLEGATQLAASMVGRWGMSPTRVELAVTGSNAADREIVQRRLMRRFERLGSQIMNRASQGSESQGSPIAAVLGDPAKRAMVAQILGQAFLTAYAFVRHNRAATERVADVLLERRDLYGDEVVELLDSVNLEIPKIDPLDEATWPTL